MFRNSLQIDVVLNLKETSSCHMRDFGSGGEGKRLDTRMSQEVAITDPGNCLHLKWSPRKYTGFWQGPLGIVEEDGEVSFRDVEDKSAGYQDRAVQVIYKGLEFSFTFWPIGSN